MARINRKVKSFVKIKGVTTSDILKMDMYNKNASTLRQYLNRIVSAANKRIRRLQKNAPNSPALASYNRENQPFTSRGLNYNEMQSMFKRVKNFLNAKTSTISGYKKHRAEIKAEIGDFKDENQEKEFWEIYNNWIDKHPNLSARFMDSFQLRDMMFDAFVIEGKTKRGASASLTKAVKKMLNDNASIKTADDLRNEDVLLNAVSDNKSAF